MHSAKIDISYLRPKKAAVLQKWNNKIVSQKETLDVWTGDDATILPLKKFPQDSLSFGRAGVLDSSGEYLELSAIPRRVQYSYPAADLEYRDEHVIYCGYWAKQWGHFLVESVARLWYAFESNEKLVFVTDAGSNTPMYGNYKEFLELLGVWNRIEIINKPTKFKRVTVPDLGYRWRMSYSDRYKDIFDRIVQNINIPKDYPTADKIFLSRSKIKNIKKIEYGHDLLDHYFSKNGYLVIHPQDITLSELIYLLKHCSECASVSGTLPHNMLFAPDHSKLTIIERNVMNNEIQLDINNMKCLDVTYIDANLAVYPINVGYGPFSMAYTKQFEAYNADRGYQEVDAYYKSRRYYKKGITHYMTRYRKFYAHQWLMTDWMIECTDMLYEAYEDSLQYWNDYICRKLPFMVVHYFMPHYWKEFVRFLLKR